jgi:hypothetical protein
VVDHIGVDDSKPEMFTMDRSSGKLLKRFCHVEQIRIHLGSFGGWHAQLHDDVRNLSLCISSDVCNWWMLALSDPMML